MRRDDGAEANIVLCVGIWKTRVSLLAMASLPTYALLLVAERLKQYYYSTRQRVVFRRRSSQSTNTKK